MRNFLLSLLIMLMIIRFFFDIVEGIVEWVLEPVNKLIKILSLATGIRVEE